MVVAVGDHCRGGGGGGRSGVDPPLGLLKLGDFGSEPQALSAPLLPPPLLPLPLPPPPQLPPPILPPMRSGAALIRQACHLAFTPCEGVCLSASFVPTT